MMKTEPYTRMDQIAACVEEARGIAASGDMKYVDALEFIARREGYSDWDALDAIAHYDFERANKDTGVLARDFGASNVLHQAVRERDHRHDRWPNNGIEIMMKGLNAVGLGYRTTEGIIVGLAVLTTIMIVPLGLHAWLRSDVVIPSRYGLYMAMVFTQTFSLWMAKRWFVMSVDPLHHIGPDVRASALVVTLITYPITIACLMVVLGWTHSNIEDILAMTVVCTPVTLWLIALHATHVRASMEAGR